MFINSSKISIVNSPVHFILLGDITEVKMGLPTGNTQEYVYKKANTPGPYRIVDRKKILDDNQMKKIFKGQKLRSKICVNGINSSLFNGEQIEIDDLIYEIFGLNKELIEEIENWYTRRFPKLVLKN